MFEDLIKNLEQEKKIITDLKSLHAGITHHPERKNFYLNSAQTLLQQLRILNNSIPELLKKASPLLQETTKNDTNKATTNTTVRIDTQTPTTTPAPKPTTPKVTSKEKQYVTINKEDKKNYLKQLKLSEEQIKNLKKQQKKKETTKEHKPSSYARIANKYFRKTAEKITPQFNSLETDLKKANIRFLLPTYLAMALLSTTLTFTITTTIFITGLLLGILTWTYAWGIILLTTITASIFYLYPSSEAGNTQKKINRELPFATIHMAAIAGSDITPTNIFNIIAESKEYPNIGKEIKKILAQTQIYGYDTVTALKNVATKTSNKKFSELLNGIATNISSGGKLKDYLQKKAENYLLDYKLERQQYTNLAGTFMDVYISILIAAPLILTMMFIVMNVAGLGLGGISINTLLTLSVIGISIINIIFLTILNIKQPKV